MDELGTTAGFVHIGVEDQGKFIGVRCLMIAKQRELKSMTAANN